MSDAYEALVDALGDLGYGVVSGTTARIERANPVFCRTLGYTEEEVRGLPDPIGALFPPEDQAAYFDAARQAEAGAALEPGEFRMRRRDGRFITMEGAVRTLDTGGHPFLLAVLKDVTSRKADEELLARYSQVVARMPGGLLVWEVEPGVAPAADRLVLMGANHAASWLLGQPVNELVGRRYGEIDEGPVLVASAEAVVTAHEQQRAFDLADLTLEDWAGEASFRSLVVPLPGDTVGVIFLDVSEQREAQRRQRELLARVVTTADEERRRIAHDLHDESLQDVAAATLLLEAAQARLRRGEVDGLEARLNDVEEMLRRSTTSVRRLLFELESPELAEGLAAATEAAATYTFAGTGTEVVVEADLPAEPEPSARLVVYRVLAEALANARRHARASRVTVRLSSSDSRLRAIVTDDGTGFATDPDEVVPGHLGLRSMAQRAELLGGWCQVTSVPGEGTSVVVDVPLSPAGG